MKYIYETFALHGLFWKIVGLISNLILKNNKQDKKQWRLQYWVSLRLVHWKCRDEKCVTETYWSYSVQSFMVVEAKTPSIRARLTFQLYLAYALRLGLHTCFNTRFYMWTRYNKNVVCMHFGFQKRLLTIECSEPRMDENRPLGKAQWQKKLSNLGFFNKYFYFLFLKT